ncbi:hypothetical protein FRC18_002609 [Serendipita sp. 400]|nr:hypothetical protein FRC18_002609 [Serendipita sp. 400]
MSVPVIIGEHPLTLEVHRRHELLPVPEARSLLSPVDGWTLNQDPSDLVDLTEGLRGAETPGTVLGPMKTNVS